MLHMRRSPEVDGQRIRTMREDAGLSQTEFARQAGISVMTLIRIETGLGRWPLPATMVKIASLLGVSHRDLRVKSNSPA